MHQLPPGGAGDQGLRRRPEDLVGTATGTAHLGSSDRGSLHVTWRLVRRLAPEKIAAGGGEDENRTQLEFGDRDFF